LRFEKWQALGNDYLIFEGTHMAPEQIRRLCDPHFGPGGDGVLLLAPADEPGYVARLRIFNPDGSEAELSGNGAREAIMYLRHRGWTSADTFSIQTVAGEIRPTITGPTTCRVDMGRASLTSKDYPDGPRDGTGTVAGYAFQHVSIGNPQCAIVVPAAELDDLDLGEIGPEIEGHEVFPNRTNVSFLAVEGDRVRARIFERGVGETLSSGTGASGAAVTAFLRGAPSRLVVELEGGELQVEIGEDLAVRLDGWAEPVFAGELSPELLGALAELDGEQPA
jgi:diaminopimelate epimerase